VNSSFVRDTRWCACSVSNHGEFPGVRSLGKYNPYFSEDWTVTRNQKLNRLGEKFPYSLPFRPPEGITRPRTRIIEERNPKNPLPSTKAVPGNLSELLA